MAKKTKTISFGNVKEYASVKERLKMFREDNPNGIIDTKTEMVGKHAILKATIKTVHDVTDERYKEASGQSFGDVTGTKGFEKLETIAVGRALANLGYLADGEIASSEEMEEFLKYQEQTDKERETVIDEMKKVDSIDDLKKYFLSLEPKHTRHKDVVSAKNERYNELKLIDIEA